jgi:hypothetical protein
MELGKVLLDIEYVVGYSRLGLAEYVELSISQLFAMS